MHVDLQMHVDFSPMEGGSLPLPNSVNAPKI